MIRRRDRDVSEALGALRAPGEDEAQERSWEVVRAAYEQRTPIRPTYRARRLAAAAVLGVALVAIGLSPAGAEVADIVSDVVDGEVGQENAKPTLRSLPAGGELLVESEEGVWVVGGDGSKRLLGNYEQATWSPNGLYVVAAAGRELIALEPDGTVRWTYAAPGEVRDPRWAGTEIDTRIAYRSGDDLRVIAGDGSSTSDHVVARDVAPVAPAWRPVGESKLSPGLGVGPYVLTYVDRAGEVRTVNADTERRLATSPADLERLSTPTTGGTGERAVSPDGSRLATLERVGGRDRLLVSADGDRTGSPLFSAPGNLTGPTWSPDGRWLLVGWPEADQWLFIRADRPHRVISFGRISEQFDPGGDGQGAFPRVTGWTLPGG